MIKWIKVLLLLTCFVYRNRHPSGKAQKIQELKEGMDCWNRKWFKAKPIYNTNVILPLIFLLMLRAFVFCAAIYPIVDCLDKFRGCFALVRHSYDVVIGRAVRTI